MVAVWWRRTIRRVGVGVLAVYVAVLVAPAFLGGSVLDKAAGDPFRGSMTSVGGWSMRERAQQTIAWADEAAGGVVVSLCEIGPGRGVLGRGFAARDYYAVDMDAGALERVGGYAAGCYLARVPPLPEEMPVVDAVVAESVLEHCRDYEEARAFVRACRGKLRPGGCIVLRFPEIRECGWRFWSEATDHAYVTSRGRVMALLGECGFRVQRQGLALDCFTGWRGWVVSRVLRCFPWRVMHDVFYRPELSSAWSRLAGKVRHGYVVGVAL